MLIGQKIKVKENLIVDQFYNNHRFHNGMSKYKGKEGYIADNPHFASNAYYISCDNEGYVWTDGMLTAVD